MSRIHIGGAGGAPSNNFIRSLRESKRIDYLIGTSCVPSDLFLADTDEKHFLPPAKASEYSKAILNLLSNRKPDFLHVQNDFEVRAISRLRERIQALGVTLYLPHPETVEKCVNKYETYCAFYQAGIKVPVTFLVETSEDLSRAFKRLGGKVWLRTIEGGGGKGALPTSSLKFATEWINHFQGWGKFMVAQQLSPDSVTWLSLWHEGELVVAQGRRRKMWKFGDRTLSGVTGITAVAETCSDSVVDNVAQDAIHALDLRPHGVFGVDMTYDDEGFPNPTEINIGRFFTTSYFFTRAGLNMPEMYCNIALEERFPELDRKINPLPDGLVWIRGMDAEPVLIRTEELEKGWLP